MKHPATLTAVLCIASGIASGIACSHAPSAAPAPVAAQAEPLAGAPLFAVRNGADEFHGDEMPIADGETVLGLCGDALVVGRAIVTTVEDPVMDDGQGQHTGKKLVFSACDAGFVVRGFGLHAGPVPIVRAPENGGDVTLTLAGNVHTVTRSHDEVAATMTLSLDGRPFATVNVSDGFVMLLFAGDFNGDGAVDAVVQQSERSNVEERVLYLSTANGDRPIAVARQRITGC